MATTLTTAQTTAYPNLKATFTLSTDAYHPQIDRTTSCQFAFYDLTTAPPRTHPNFKATFTLPTDVQHPQLSGQLHASLHFMILQKP